MGYILRKNDKKKVVEAKETCWEVEIDTVSECGKAPDVIDVFISPLAKDKIERLMEKFTNIEWLAYLVGEDYNIKDIYIPKQSVSAGSVTGIDSSVCNRLPVIGVIHSHHGMGNGFSGTDDEWINQNNDISLCISKSGINGQVRWETPCGSLNIVKAVVRLKMDVDYDIEEFENIIEKNIKKETIIYKGNYVKNYVKKNSYNGQYGIQGFDDDDGVEAYIESLKDKDDERTLEEELSYMENSGMFDFDDEKNVFTS